MRQIETKPVKKGGQSKLYIPKELAIETVFGCNLSCDMCFIDMPTARQKQVMSMELFHSLVDELTPHVDRIKKVSLWSLGEPLLDPHLCERIVYLKEKGFRNLAISTNADLLDEGKQEALLATGIETIIFSVDGVKKETHEAIRRGSDFDRVVANCRSIIAKRDAGDYPTRFIVRFIRQESNRNEWPTFLAFWSDKVSRKRNDQVSSYDMHNHGGYVGKKKDILAEETITPEMERKACHYIFETLIVLADGSLALCPADFLEARMNPAKLPKFSAIAAFNSEDLRRIRKIHSCGSKSEIEICAQCTIPYSAQTRLFT